MYFACDIGGTKMRIAQSEDCRDFSEPIIEETPARPEDGINLLIETILRMANGREKIDAVAVGLAGVLNEDHTFLIRSPHLSNWERIPLAEKLQKALNTKIHIENDTDIVGLGEALAGAGRGYEIVVYITVSTGIGGVKIVKGKFEKNRFGFEPGFQILNHQTGENWEELCSGTAVEKKFHLHPKEVAKTKDWEEIEKNVSIGLHNSILHWSPDVLVLGGSMSKDFDVEKIKKQISAMMKIHPSLPEMKIAELGSIGGIYGGFAFLKNYYNL